MVVIPPAAVIPPAVVIPPVVGCRPAERLRVDMAGLLVDTVALRAGECLLAECRLAAGSLPAAPAIWALAVSRQWVLR